MTVNKSQLLTDAQMKSEISRCNYCEEKPCRDACPSQCSPADFIMAVQKGEPQDFKRAASMILGKNPLGGICGAVCPDSFCMQACTHETFDRPLNIPAIQATIIQKAKDLGRTPEFIKPKPLNKKVAVVGAGPSALAASSVLAQKGIKVELFDNNSEPGGMCRLIPDSRLDKSILDSDIQYLLALGDIEYHPKRNIENPGKLLDQNYDAVLVCNGLDTPMLLSIPGKEYGIPWDEFLTDEKYREFSGEKIAVIGGGAVALDCAINAKTAGAARIDIICLEKLSEMNLDKKEKEELFRGEFGLVSRTKISAIEKNGSQKNKLVTELVELPAGEKFNPAKMRTLPDTQSQLEGYDLVVFAIGAKSSLKIIENEKIFFTGDNINGPTTVIEAVASGKNTASLITAYLLDEPVQKFENLTRSKVQLEGNTLKPVSLGTEFFGIKINSPFLLSAAPPTDGYEQMKKAYEAGWAGGIMKTAFDNLPIHIPSEYMYVLDDQTFGNADNVSAHPLDRVCDEISRLVKEFPDRLTIGSTGGPVTGNDPADKAVWQSNTTMLENAGAMGIEYSLSCPQGGDGTKGDIVSQDPELTAKIVAWIMEISKPEIPKLFKLTGAVTAIYPILVAIKEVLDKYPDKKAGVTLANTFPGLEFQDSENRKWEEGVVIGMSGQGVVNISNLTLANASKVDIKVSGNGGPMNYKSAADFLALGAETVQFCSIVMKYGYGIIDELHSGLSYLLAEKGFSSVKELIGAALPDPIIGFMDLSPVKKISSSNPDLCVKCGNCTRCPYLAISLDEEKHPLTDASKCIGCSFCVQNCFAGALEMRERTEDETLALKE